MAAGMTGKLLYALLFTVAVPLLLFCWARGLEGAIRLPVPGAFLPGLLIALWGAATLAIAMAQLIVRGGGLPMNLSPPPRHVSSGLYAFARHPIYVGFVLLCAGLSVAARSSAGLWVVTPVALLGTVALVYGYEGRATRERFGTGVPRPFLSLPPADDETPTWKERFGALVMVAVPWFALYHALSYVSAAFAHVDTRLPFERGFFAITWTHPAYAATYLSAFAIPLLSSSRRVLRRVTLAGAATSLAAFWLYAVLPLGCSWAPIDPHDTSLFAKMLRDERAWDTPGNACPSLHAAWVTLFALALAERFPRLRAVAAASAIVVCASCWTTGMHSVIDLVTGALLAVALRDPERLWTQLLALSERVANSWRDVRLGFFRVINHGAYVGLGSCVGLLIVEGLTGGRFTLEIGIVAVSGLLGAALWAQVIEGASGLLRPFGFYGGVLGASAALAGLATLSGVDLRPLVGAFAVAAPFIQGIGRLRCLVQGCCHGAPCAEALGIRYTRPLSRVVKAGLGNVPVHPTQLHSIVTNLAIGPLLVRLWLEGAAPMLIAGLYLVLNSLARFVEEGYRGEPQTPVPGGLHLYQWASIGALLGGIALTLVPSRAAIVPLVLTPAGLTVAVAFGLLTFAAMGVDLPGSSSRFSRLA